MSRFSKSIWTIAILGIVIRTVAYLQNRSLWLDEILLALNVMRLSFAQLATPPLALHQMAPIGFLYLCKAVVTVFGFGEMALRLVPFLAGLFTVVLFPFVAEKCLRRRAIPYAMTFCALSFGLIYYSSEFKQYSSDAMASMLLYLVGMVYLQSKDSKPLTIVCQLLAIAFACLNSFSSFFVSLSLLVVMVARTVKNKRWHNFLLVGLFASCMALCYYGLYETSFRNIDPGGHDSFLSDWRRNHAFMPTTNFRFERLIWYFTKPLAPLLMVHPSPEMQGLLAIIWVVGAAILFRNSSAKAILLILPSVFALIASAMEIYPWSGRFLVFLAPMVCLVLGEGTLSFVTTIRRKAPIVATLFYALLILSLTGITLVDFAYSREKENPRKVFEYIQESGSPYDVIFLYDHCVHHFKYYSKTIDFGNCSTDSGHTATPEYFQDNFPGQKVWVVYSTFLYGRTIADLLRKHFQVIDSTSERGIEGLLIDCSTYKGQVVVPRVND